MKVTVIALGTMSKKYFSEAFAEYRKRFSAFGSLECVELREKKLSASPSDAEIFAALEAEADDILAHVPKKAALLVMAVEGKMLSSGELSSYLDRKMTDGASEFCFVIGSSYGLSDRVKKSASLLLSMSAMTFPHQLARVMLAEQIYRAMEIRAGTKYHK